MGADNVLPKIIRAKLLIDAQGYHVKKNILYQDSQATIRLEVNGRLSGTSWAKHIKVFFTELRTKWTEGNCKLFISPLR